MGNMCADALADRAADEQEVDRGIAQELLSQVAALQRVQKRTVAILALVARSAKAGHKDPAPRKLERPSFPGAAALSSQHKTAHIGSMIWCHVCQQARAASQTQVLAEWLDTPCRGYTDFAARSFVAAIQPRSLPHNCAVHIGRAEVHATHKLWRFRAVFWCDACGASAVVKPQHLREPCPQVPRSNFAAASRKAFRAGKFPKALDQELVEKLMVLEPAA